MSDNLSSSSSNSEVSIHSNLLSFSNIKTEDNPLAIKAMKTYQADQQVKYLHLQAEIDMLLQQLQSIKQQRLLEKNAQTEDKQKQQNALVSV
jgi:hypothetical protein